MLLLVLLLVAGSTLLIVPTIVIIGSSFGATGFLAFPPHGITLRWFAQAFTDPAYLNSFLTSVEIATAATVLAVLLGTPAAYALARWDFPGRDVLEAVFLLPLALPAIVLSLALVIMDSRIGLLPSASRLIMAHLPVCLPCVIRVMVSAFRRSDRSVEHAARVFGASPAAVFFLVTLPLAQASLAGAATLAWVVSFDDLELALFNASPASPTLPISIYGAIEVGVPPVVAAVCTLLIATAAIGAGLWQWTTRPR